MGAEEAADRYALVETSRSSASAPRAADGAARHRSARRNARPPADAPRRLDGWGRIAGPSGAASPQSRTVPKVSIGETTCCVLRVPWSLPVFFAEVSAADLPFVVLLVQQRAAETQRGEVGGEDSDDIGASSDLAVDPFEWVRRSQLRPVRGREREEPNMSSSAPSSSSATFGASGCNRSITSPTRRRAFLGRPAASAERGARPTPCDGGAPPEVRPGRRPVSRERRRPRPRRARPARRGSRRR